MTDFEKCRLPDGTFDHKKYDELRKQENAERKAKGELCQLPNCNRFIMWSSGLPQTCGACKSLDNPEELHHDDHIRCPKCGRHWNVFDGESYELQADGEHDVTCPDCNHEFEIVTTVRCSFQSPERMKEAEAETDERKETL